MREKRLDQLLYSLGLVLSIVGTIMFYRLYRSLESTHEILSFCSQVLTYIVSFMAIWYLNKLIPGKAYEHPKNGTEVTEGE